jgi:hypothetical protein
MPAGFEQRRLGLDVPGRRVAGSPERRQDGLAAFRFVQPVLGVVVMPAVVGRAAVPPRCGPGRGPRGVAGRGVDIVRPPVREPWVLIEMWIADPDGARFVLVEVPADHPIRSRPGI